MRAALILLALGATLAFAADSESAKRMQDAVQSAFLNVGLGKAGTAGSYGSRFCFKETSFCADSLSAYGENWVNTIACCRDDDEQDEGLRDISSSPNVGWCYMSSYLVIGATSLGTPPPNTAVRYEFTATCFFADGHDSCVGELAGTKLTVTGMALYNGNVVSPVKPSSVAVAQVCYDGVTDPSARLGGGAARNDTAARKHSEKDGDVASAAKPGAAAAKVQAAAIGAAQPSYGGEGYGSVSNEHTPTTYYRSVDQTVYFGKASVFDKKRGVTRKGWFNYFWQRPGESTYDEVTPEQVASAGYTVMMPYQITLDLPTDKEEYA